MADFVSLGCGMATTFGSKTIEVVDDVGNVSKYTRFDRSPSNIKTNVLKTFGFKVDKTSVVVDEAGVAKTTISNLDDIGNTSLQITRGSQEATYKATTLEKQLILWMGRKQLLKRLH